MLEQELKKANSYLVRFFNAHKVFSLVMSLSLISAAILVVLLIVRWLLFGSIFILQGAVFGFALVAVGFLIAFWWRQRRERYFRKIRERCLILQRAGYVVHKMPFMLRNVLMATYDPPKDENGVLDFETIDAWDLYYKMV